MICSHLFALPRYRVTEIRRSVNMQNIPVVPRSYGQASLAPSYKPSIRAVISSNT